MDKWNCVFDLEAENASTAAFISAQSVPDRPANNWVWKSSRLGLDSDVAAHDALYYATAVRQKSVLTVVWDDHQVVWSLWSNGLATARCTIFAVNSTTRSDTGHAVGVRKYRIAQFPFHIVSIFCFMRVTDRQTSCRTDTQIELSSQYSACISIARIETWYGPCCLN